MNTAITQNTPPSKYTHISLDLETTSLSPNAGILSIGAVEIVGFLDLHTKPRDFYERMDFETLEKCGFHIQEETMLWWEKQPLKVRLEAFGGTRSLVVVLEDLAKWVKSFDKPVCVWTNGADFDIPILKNAYDRLDLEHSYPFEYRNHRCYRTLKSLCAKEAVDRVSKNTEEHNALADAKYQARVASSCFMELCRVL